jgi:glycosyltransferase involved in cell wall biosynthesis
MDTIRKKISVASGCYNEEGNLQEWYDRLIKMFQQFPMYDYEIIIADNCSTDSSREILRKLAARDKNFKVILNSNNFGQITSAYNAFLQTSGDASVIMCSDLQEPPEMIAEFIRKWEAGNQAVVAVKSKSRENPLMFLLRKCYYRLLAHISDSNEIIQNFTGFGLYDRKFMDALRLYKDPMPYFRGLVSEIGFKRATVEFVQERRKHGLTQNNFFRLYEYAITGFVNHSKLPLRLATFSGFCLAGMSLIIALIYLIYKLMFWNTFNLGLAPLIIGLFFFSAVQLIFIGIIGEYIGAIYTQVKNKPLAIEEEKLNFD